MRFPDTFANLRIAVIGDVMLDRYWWGNVTRISPEAPVPVVKLGRTSVAAGGAANVAANIAGLGASAILVGVTGKDTEADILRGMVSENPLIDCRLIELGNRDTTIKTRIVAHNQHVVRLDQETTEPINAAQAETAITEISAAINQADAVVVSDYAKGFLTDDVLASIFRLAKTDEKIVIVDPKSTDLTKYSQATVITPNLKEAAASMQYLSDLPSNVANLGNEIRAALGLRSVLITEGENGMTLLEDDSEPFHLDALAHDVFDVTGAGDTVIAAFSVAVASGMNFREAATLANIAAGIAVGHIGTTVVTRSEIEHFINTETELARGV